MFIHNQAYKKKKKLKRFNSVDVSSSGPLRKPGKTWGKWAKSRPTGANDGKRWPTGAKQGKPRKEGRKTCLPFLPIIALAKVIARKIKVRHLAMAKTCLLVEEMLGILLYTP